ncbi:disrupted in schizophrenia 1 protein isoform X2 [Mustela erminea]|uniref:disrupted in schizophrenia 1 protein isoform X2 n=1 Tax=Mustela erminea TaxID=36723 RepID=UPI001386C43B|nr:disrupted in schizophrenia 1 protein isoform X2 [Mustela erminea]
MLGGGPQGALAGGGGGRGAGGRDCLPPAASLRRRRLARRPGYMRSTAGPRIGFLYPAAATALRAQGGACGEESHQSESRAGRGGLDPGGQWRGPSVGSPVPRSTAASARTPVGYGGLARTPARRPSGLFGIQFQVGTTLPARPARSCGPGDAGWQGELPSMDSSEAPGAGWDAGGGERTKDTWTKGRLFPEEVNGDSCGLGSDPRVPSAPGSSQDTFTSSFSFIRLSLGSAGERGEAEGCPPSREAEAPCQSPKDTEAKAASLDRPHEHPRLLSPHFYLKTTQRLADPAQTAGGSHRLERETPTLLDGDTTSCFSPGPSGSDGSSLGDAQRWETLVRRCEPVLLDCLLSDQRRLEVKSLRIKLQKLQEKAVEDDDYDKAEALRHRLEELDTERSNLHFQLPSRQPALCSLLGHLHAQVQAAEHRRATPPACGEDPHALPRGEPKLLEPSAQDSLRVSVTRRDWLLQEKQQLQKEIEALQARMSVLEAKDQQLRRDIEEQELLLRWEDCDLPALVCGLSPGELREVSEALRDTLALASQIPLRAEPPETLTSLQEQIKSLNLSLKEITAKVCTSERLGSTLRKKVSDIEDQLPVLLEAKMLAVSGSHFSTAKELTEEIRSLTSEREALEGLLDKLPALSSRNVQKLGGVKEDYSRLRRQLDEGETAYEMSVKESALKYMEMLEDKLRSCKCPLLGKVWGADLEACRLLIQSLQLQEATSTLSAEDEKQTDDLVGTICPSTLAISPRLHYEVERKTSLQVFEDWKAHPSPSLYFAGSEQKEESWLLSLELGEKCEAINKKLLYLEDQLHTAIHSHDEDLIQSLRRELQMVKETLQAMSLQLQPAKEAGEREATASCVTAGVREVQA